MVRLSIAILFICLSLGGSFSSLVKAVEENLSYQDGIMEIGTEKEIEESDEFADPQQQGMEKRGYRNCIPLGKTGCEANNGLCCREGNPYSGLMRKCVNTGSSDKPEYTCREAKGDEVLEAAKDELLKRVSLDDSFASLVRTDEENSSFQDGKREFAAEKEIQQIDELADPQQRVHKCVSRNTNYAGKDVEKRKAASWRACAARCNADGRCKAWTYVSNDHPVEAYRGNCHLRKSGYRTQRGRRGVYSGVTGCGVVADACVRVDTNYAGNELPGTRRKVPSWQACATRCNDVTSCKAWSYATDDHPVEAYRGNCHLKNYNYNHRVRNTKGVFSGRKGCGWVAKCVSIDTNYGGNNLVGWQHEGKAPSWQACAAKCRTTGKCLSWSYASNGHPVRAYRRNCHLKTKYKANVQRTKGVYSGASNCGAGK